MRDAWRYTGLLVTAVLSWGMYILLHESGHLVMSVLCGVRVIAVKLWPLPYVVCEAASGVKAALIALAGTLFPLLAAGVPVRSFWGWYVTFLLRVIAVYSLILSLGGLTVGGVIAAAEDISLAATLAPSIRNVLTVVCAGLLFVIFISIVRDRPLKRCAAYFGY